MRNREFLRKKLEKGLIGFNVFNKGSMYAVVSAYSQKGFAFVQITKKTIDYYGIKNIVALRRECEKDFEIPVFLHLDHGDKKYALLAIKNGFDSVMLDFADKKLNENIKKTNEIKEEAWKRNVLVEAEVGELGGFSKKEDVEVFVEKTKVDMLAVSIGSKHGMYKKKIKPGYLYNFKNIKTNLVLHGASYIFKEDVEEINKYGGKLGKVKGLSEEEIKECLKRGIKKLNMDTTLRLAYLAGIRKYLAKNPKEIDARKILGAGEERIYKRTKEIIKKFI